jgi:hypothetical protein
MSRIHRFSRLLTALAVVATAPVVLPSRAAHAAAGGTTLGSALALPITPAGEFVGDNTASSSLGSGSTASAPYWSNTTWWSYTPASSQVLTIRANSISPSGWDNALEVWTASGTFVGMSDDSYGLDAMLTVHLTGGTAYRIALGGYGPGSKGTATLSLGSQPPDRPTHVSATAGDHGASVAWTAPFDNYAAITQYKIYCDVNGAGPAASPCKTISGTPPSTSTTLTNLTNGATYAFTVVAVNANGSSAASSASSIVTPIGAKTAQTITFPALDAHRLGDPPFDLAATASSGLAVTFTAADSCTISGATVTITHAGTCTITAHQAGDATYDAATDVAQTFTIAKIAQTITFTDPGSHRFGDPPFDLHAIASSALAITFTASGSCTVTDVTVTIAGAGPCTVTARQSGDDDYLAAIDASYTVAVAKATQTITFGMLKVRTFGEAPFVVRATATSGLPVNFTISGPCAIHTTMVTINGAGRCTVTAHQLGNHSYEAAIAVARAFTIAEATPMITLPAPTPRGDRAPVTALPSPMTTMTTMMMKMAPASTAAPKDAAERARPSTTTAARAHGASANVRPADVAPSEPGHTSGVADTQIAVFVLSSLGLALSVRQLVNRTGKRGLG